jgi:membrane fusion protein (multidrug efflux system)
MKNFALFLSVAALALSSPAGAQQKGGGQGPVPVIIASAYTDHFVDRVEAIGTLRANETITLASTVTETITAVNFIDGQRVKKGDILVEMTSAEEKALLDQQRALVNEAQKQLDRTRDLAKSGAASSSLLDERQREYSSTRAGLGALQSRLEDHIIVAPFDGVVGLRNISVGALLQPATVITTLDDDSVMKLDFAVPSVFLPTLKPGLAIVATASGFGEEFKGEITAIDSQIDQATRSVMVRATIPNPEAKLKPGLLMTVELLKNPRESVGVPETAIIPEGRKHSVLVIDETQNPPTVEKREIALGTRREGDVEVVDKLKAGEKVVVQGTMVARPGGPVKITAEQQKGESLQDVLKRISGEKEQPEDGQKEGQ